MSYDSWKTTPPDDDPYGEDHARQLADERCPDCGAEHDQPCDKSCGCVYCRKRELLNQPQLVRAIPAQREGKQHVG